MIPLRVWFALCLGAAGPALAAPLTFSDALTQAEQYSARLAAQTARIEAAQAASIPAQSLPDAKLLVGIDNVPVSGPDQGRLTQDFMTMQKIGVMQDIPNPAKRKARKEMGQAMIAQERAKQTLSKRIVRRDVATAWVKRFYLEQRGAILDELAHENRLLADSVNAQWANGNTETADALLPRLAMAELDDRRDVLTRERADTDAMLRRWIGPAANDGIKGKPPIISIDANRLRNHLQAHPEIAMFDPMARVAQAEIREAAAAKQPDWGVEFSYGRRGEEFGDVISLQFTVDLPVFPEYRQDPLIAEKRSELAIIDADRAEMERRHWARLESQLARFEWLTRQSERMQSQWLPLMREKVDLQLAGYRSGTVALTRVLEARREWINQRLQALALEEKRTILAVQLQIFYGEAQP